MSAGALGRRMPRRSAAAAPDHGEVEEVDVEVVAGGVKVEEGRRRGAVGRR